MKRRVSDVLVVIYGVGLLIALLSAAAVTYALLGPGDVVYAAVPPWAVLALSYVFPALIALRLWVHIRARKAAASPTPVAEPAAKED